MAFENLDLESKVYIPTQQLVAQLQADFLNGYSALRQELIDAHDTVAMLSKKVYDNPGETLPAWYDQAVASCTDLYAGWFEKVLPQAEQSYLHALTATSDTIIKAQNSLAYIIENPKQVSAEAIETITKSFASAGDVSAELLEAVEAKSAEIIALLSEHPIQTLESATMETLTVLLDAYFDLVNALLVNL